ncbi:hypothetical protein [Hymenobacter psychrotolerans]|uniref:Uncharacterized protein n=1 Tax=Hymenobacter psychrotolerans DSM 18569 TaxID=1121959 RepID=A0A1M6Z8X6_9BACT|nr:hypothetical protein [Hymenobacter psychrotolerans]SHL26843.1 hypothetical protein SAMN02746009_02458 [Hymenobacter psychrotolerans DSM 18569]
MLVEVIEEYQDALQGTVTVGTRMHLSDVLAGQKIVAGKVVPVIDPQRQAATQEPDLPAPEGQVGVQ